MKYKVSFILLFLFISAAIAREKVTIDEQKKITIISDTALRQGDNEVFQALGNVIITHQKDALYGEAAELNLNSGEVSIEGNVRYITEEVVMYGSKLIFNFNTDALTIYNARILSGDMVILGGKISKVAPGKMIAEKAEFTSCKDCPESWSIYGEDVRITLGEYVTIKHGLVKASSVPILYVPYLIFPIKKKRQTGLLFPKISRTSTASGIVYKQPWFWAISESSDLTITPGVFGRRGYGSVLQYRQVLGERKWWQFDGLGVFDRIYDPHYIRGQDKEVDYFRYYGQYEQHFQFGNWFNHHLMYTDNRDLDIHRDFENELGGYNNSTDDGLSTFFDLRSNYANLTSEMHFRKNKIVPDPREFDHSYVQVLPKLSLSLVPFAPIQSSFPLFNYVGVGADIDYTVFKQNHVKEDTYIRNALRTNFRPYLDWHFGNIGPLHFQTNIEGEYQRYKFPSRETSDRGGNKFSKRSAVIKTSMSLELEKIFGLAYKEKFSVKDVKRSSLEESQQVATKMKMSEDILGELPVLQTGLTDDYVTESVNSYKHSQEWKINHIITTGSSFQGSEQWREQISDNNGAFDYVDFISGEEENLGSVDSRTDLEQDNILELQLFNSLIKKTARSLNILNDNQYLRDNFSYGKVAYFNISQGIVLNESSDDYKEKLTRLGLQAGLSLGTFGINVSEYFFYLGSRHVVNVSLSKNFTRGSLSVGMNYNSVIRNTAQKLYSQIVISPVDEINIQTYHEFDLRSQNNNSAYYTVTYLPRNDCWEFQLSYRETPIDNAITFDFNLLIEKTKNVTF